jgi:hypothetical protein
LVGNARISSDVVEDLYMAIAYLLVGLLSSEDAERPRDRRLGMQTRRIEQRHRADKGMAALPVGMG